MFLFCFVCSVILQIFMLPGFITVLEFLSLPHYPPVLIVCFIVQMVSTNTQTIKLHRTLTWVWTSTNNISSTLVLLKTSCWSCDFYSQTVQLMSKPLLIFHIRVHKPCVLHGGHIEQWMISKLDTCNDFNANLVVFHNG